MSFEYKRTGTVLLDIFLIIIFFYFLFFFILLFDGKTRKAIEKMPYILGRDILFADFISFFFNIPCKVKAQLK